MDCFTSSVCWMKFSMPEHRFLEKICTIVKNKNMYCIWFGSFVNFYFLSWQSQCHNFSHLIYERILNKQTIDNLKVLITWLESAFVDLKNFTGCPAIVGVITPLIVFPEDCTNLIICGWPDTKNSVSFIKYYLRYTCNPYF